MKQEVPLNYRRSDLLTFFVHLRFSIRGIGETREESGKDILARGIENVKR